MAGQPNPIAGELPENDPRTDQDFDVHHDNDGHPYLADNAQVARGHDQNGYGIVPTPQGSPQGFHPGSRRGTQDRGHHTKSYLPAHHSVPFGRGYANLPYQPRNPSSLRNDFHQTSSIDSILDTSADDTAHFTPAEFQNQFHSEDAHGPHEAYPEERMTFHHSNPATHQDPVYNNYGDKQLVYKGNMSGQCVMEEKACCLTKIALVI